MAHRQADKMVGGKKRWSKTEGNIQQLTRNRRERYNFYSGVKIKGSGNKREDRQVLKYMEKRGNNERQLRHNRAGLAITQVGNLTVHG